LLGRRDHRRKRCAE